jgi:hypothetical protein
MWRAVPGDGIMAQRGAGWALQKSTILVHQSSITPAHNALKPED